MSVPDDRWVEKVHPLARVAEANDPYELVATPAVGDPDVMFDCIVQEFLWMGWSREELVALFDHPGYPVLCELKAYFGPAEVERRVAALVAPCGQLQFREVIAEPDDETADDHALELLQILPCPEPDVVR